MNQNLTNEMEDHVKPFYNLAETQMQTAQKLMQAQIDLMGECMEVGTRYTDSLQNNRDVGAYFRVPMEASREIQEKMINSASRQWDILLEARDGFSDIAESSERKVKKDMARVEGEAKQQMGKAQEETRQTAKKETAKRKEESSK